MSEMVISLCQRGHNMTVMLQNQYTYDQATKASQNQLELEEMQKWDSVTQLINEGRSIHIAGSGDGSNQEALLAPR